MGKSMSRVLKGKKQIWLTLIVVVLAFAMALVIILSTCREYETIPLQEHWGVTFDSTEGTDFTDISLEDIPFSKAEVKDTICLRTVLPKNTLVQPQLSLHVSHCAVDVYLDGQCIYTYGDEIYQKGGLLGCGYFFVPLPENFEGKVLSIRLRTVKESKFNYLEETCIISAQDALKRLATDNFLSTMISIFLVIMGMIELGSISLLIRAKKPIRTMISIAAFSFLMAFWMSCCDKTIQFLIRDYGKIAFIEYVPMYFLPVGVISIVYDFFAQSLHKKLARVFEAWFLLLACAVVVMQILNICNMSECAWIFRVSLIAAIVLGVAFLVAERNVSRTLEEKVEINGLIVFLIFVFLETLRYCFKKNYNFATIGNQSLLPFGVLVWICAMLARFVIAMYRSFVSHMRHELLMKIAYTDALTAISNRTKCEEVLQDYDKNKRPIFLINMDLNGFKAVNDTYGHSEGDQLLCVFANILQEVFGNIATVGRMGGDEFIVIMDASMEACAEEFLHKLTQKVNEHNENEQHPYLLQFAYGYATNEGNEAATPWDVYKEADEKMYDCKRKQKMKRLKEG